MKKQHTAPCSDCPWRRVAMKGWLGVDDNGELATPQYWLEKAVGEVWNECHKNEGCQCAGMSIFRANICKVPRFREILRLPQDTAKVFATPQEFINHHTRSSDVDNHK